MVIPVVAYTDANCKTPGEQVPVLLLFEQECYIKSSIPNKKSVEKKKEEAEKEIIPATELKSEAKEEKTQVEKRSYNINITNQTIINNYNSEKPDTTKKIQPAIIPAIPVTPKDKLRIYVAGGIEYNNELERAIPQVALGLQYKKLSFGINCGYDNFLSKELESFPNGQDNGGTYINKNISNQLTEYGAEIGFDVAKHLTLYLGAQNNILIQKIDGTVEFDVKDDAGNWRYKKLPLDTENFRKEYITLNPGIGVKVNKHFSIYGGPEIDVKTKELTGGHAWLRYTFGKK